MTEKPGSRPGRWSVERVEQVADLQERTIENFKDATQATGELPVRGCTHIEQAVWKFWKES